MTSTIKVSGPAANILFNQIAQSYGLRSEQPKQNAHQKDTMNPQFINKTCLLLRLPEHSPADNPVLFNYVGPLAVPGRGDKLTHEGLTYIVTGREFHTSAVDGVQDVILELVHV